MRKGNLQSHKLGVTETHSPAWTGNWEEWVSSSLDTCWGREGPDRPWDSWEKERALGSGYVGY